MPRKYGPDFERRALLQTLGALAPALLLGCGGASSAKDGALESDAATTSGDAATASSIDSGACSEIPDETGGPYPDVDSMISNPTYDRSDITEGKTGTPLTLTLNVVDTASSCAAIAGARVIVWHCDANGVYSEYATSMNAGNGETGSTTTTFLRGWQTTDAGGNVTFKTIYPGWYTPRVTHIHFMVYNPSDLTTPVKTTQFCFPDSVNQTVYAQTSLYAKGQNTTTDSSDMVFGGSTEDLVATISGNTTSGYTATLRVGLATY